MKKAKIKKLRKLIRQQTRAEIMARHGGFDGGEYYTIAIEKMDRVRKLLFGTSDLVSLGLKWGIIKERKKK